MLQKWKDILTNWINCYFNESDKREQCVTVESLISIISHLRENLSLDESKSSILEAHTIEEFVREKYPEFRLEHGSVEASGDDETCYVASLLLFFVCVNSKDVNMKSAMCSRLSGEDQETILKFSKRLMECSPITLKDVKAAIVEACGQDTPLVEASGSRATVAETPPALRSLHGEVRRLQAALEAERFDRNYLQEELARTNLRVEKHAKEKEEYKVEIMNLKAKISLCCGQEADSRAGDAAADSSARLMRQLEETEERLVHAQGMLEDARDERDAYRAKINELKQERDKWLTFSQEESQRASQASEELEAERQQAASLRELVAELRHHNQRNRLDCSQLECDDPDATVHSLPHNSSICSEACANVIEVQLEEERAKIEVLKQHIQSLQDQLSELAQKSENEKHSLERIVSERENDIFNLKHRINEEIEEKNNMTIQYSDDVSKLNNEINELEQKLKDNNNQFRLILETKLQEIQTLQEEKLSLLQSLTDETTKLENDIKSLKSELEIERNTRAKMKDDYESHIMKLNEKVLNRNNELVELQNNIFEKSEKIESLYLEIRKEKQSKEEINAKHRDEVEDLNRKLIQCENALQRKNEEINSLMERLNYNYDFIKQCERDIEDLKYSLSQQNEHSRVLEETKISLIEKLTHKDNQIEELNKDFDNLKNVYSEQHNKLSNDLDSAIATINTLQMQLQDELKFKIGLQNEHSNLEHAKTILLNEVENLKDEIKKLQSDNENKDKAIEGMGLFLQEEKHINEKLKLDCETLNEKLREASKEIDFKNKGIRDIKEKLVAETNCLQEELRYKDVVISGIEQKLSSEIEERASSILLLNNEKETIFKELSEKKKEIAEMREQISEMTEKSLQVVREHEIALDETRKTLSGKETQIFELQMEVDRLQQKQQQIVKDNETANATINKLQMQLQSELQTVTRIQDEFDNLKHAKELLVNETENLKTELIKLRSDNENKEKTIKQKDLSLQEEKRINEKLSLDCEHLNEKLREVSDEVDLKTKEMKNIQANLIAETNSLHEELRHRDETIIEMQQKLSSEIEERTSSLLLINNEKETISKEMREKSTEIEKMREQISRLTEKSLEVAKEHETSLSEMKQMMDKKETQVNELQAEVDNLQQVVEENRIANDIIATLQKQLQDEFQLKIGLQNEQANLEHSKTLLLNEIDNLKQELKKSHSDIHNKEKTIEGMDLFLQEEKRVSEKLILDCNKLNDKLNEAAEEIKLKNNEIKDIKEKLLTENNSLKVEIRHRDKTVSDMEQKLSSEIEEKASSILSITNEKQAICKELSDKQAEIVEMREQISKITEMSIEVALEHENVLSEVRDSLSKKETQVFELQAEVNNLKQIVSEHKIELSKQKESFATTADTNARNIQTLQQENQSLINELNDVRVQLEVKVHSLKEKLTDNENLTEKLKNSYECQIENLNVMLTTLSNCLKDKTLEVDVLRKEKERLQELVEDNSKVNAILNKLQMELQDELRSKLSLQNEYDNLKHAKELLLKDNESQKDALEKLQSDIQTKNKTIEETYLSLQEQKQLSEELQIECDKLNKKLNEAAEQINVKNNEIEDIKAKLVVETVSLREEIHHKDDIISSMEQKLSSEIEEKAGSILLINNEKETISKKLTEKRAEIAEMQEQISELTEKNLEVTKIHDTVVSEIRRMLSEKETQVFELQTEVNRLQQIVEENKIELSKQKESYVTSADTNARNIQTLQQENQSLINELNDVRVQLEVKVHSLKEKLTDNENLTEKLKEKYECQIDNLNVMVTTLTNCLKDKTTEMEVLRKDKQELVEDNSRANAIIKNLQTQLQDELQVKTSLQGEYDNLKHAKALLLNEFENVKDEVNKLQSENQSKDKAIEETNLSLQNEKRISDELTLECDNLNEKVREASNEIDLKNNEIKDKEKLVAEVKSLQEELHRKDDMISSMEKKLSSEIEERASLILLINNERETISKELSDKKAELVEMREKLTKMIEMNRLAQEYETELSEMRQTLSKKETQVFELQTEVRQTLSKKETQVFELQTEVNRLQQIVEENKIEMSKQKESYVTSASTNEQNIQTLQQENQSLINELNDVRVQLEVKVHSLKEKLTDNENLNEKLKEKYECQIDDLNVMVNKLTDCLKEKTEELDALRRDNERLQGLVENNSKVAVVASEKTGIHKTSCPEKEYRDFLHQVDSTTSDLTHSSMESIKTISDLERIIHDKNRTITTLQSDITYLKSLIADSENKLLDVNKELEVSKENCHQLSAQLKKIVHQKNDEIAELRRQVSKMSVTENRATQIIKVSAKYQAIILKRIAEIKTNTVLKELTNFGNTANGDNDLRRSLNAGTITMEDLENFLETTDKHLKRCSEKQVALQKERDRLTEVNRINESEIINLKKFLTEMSVSFKTFSTVRDLYAQKFSRVVQMQRTVRREILNLDGRVNDATMCKLERGYAAVMQDLAECVMNMERWVERSIGRTVSTEKIKQAFTGDEDRASLATTTFQNTGLEVQLEELENSFQKLLEEVVRAPKGEGATEPQALTVMEVRAEYEDKLNRMKSKMKQLYHEQISMYKEKQKEEVCTLKRELLKTREKMAELSRAYEEHIRALTAELWSVGEKFLTKKDEVDWLRKRQMSGSLMSLQHVHSSGLVHPQEEPSRPSDTHSLRSLPVHNSTTNTNKRDGRGMHMSDEEGEVFDNRWLKELAATPRRAGAGAGGGAGGGGAGGGVRLSELRWRNSLCPPHLKSSYPAETQFANTFDEEDIKFSLGGASSVGGRNQRKEVGITAYKKPGPPTPSKQAGRLSATDSELRESLRVEPEPAAARKTSTPSRLRALFRSNKNDTNEGTPRSKRLSIFRKK